MTRKKTAFHFWPFTGQRNRLMPKETKRPGANFPLISTPHCLNAHEIENAHKMALYIWHERVNWQDPNLFSNMQAIRKGKNNENMNGNVISRAFSLLIFTSFNVKKKLQHFPAWVG